MAPPPGESAIQPLSLGSMQQPLEAATWPVVSNPKAAPTTLDSAESERFYIWYDLSLERSHKMKKWLTEPILQLADRAALEP